EKFCSSERRTARARNPSPPISANRTLLARRRIWRGMVPSRAAGSLRTLTVNRGFCALHPHHVENSHMFQSLTRRILGSQSKPKAFRPLLERLEDRLVLSNNPNLIVPVYNSLPGAKATLYLDFNGDFTLSWGGYLNIDTPAYDTDGDPNTFSATE